MTCNNKPRILFSILLFLLMTSFTVSSYAAPCQDFGESKVELDSKQNNTSVNNQDYNVSIESGVIQNNNCCQNCMGICCSLCKEQHQSLSVLIIKESKNYQNYHKYKNINDSLQALLTNNLIIYKATYKYNRSYSSSLFHLSQTIQKHRVLLI